MKFLKYAHLYIYIYREREREMGSSYKLCNSYKLTFTP